MNNRHLHRDDRQGSRGRPTKAQAKARTEHLLDTARDLFSRKGFASASLEEIAALMRSSKHTIYRRFPNKLALLEAVVDRDVDRFRAALIRAGEEEGEPVAALRAMARAYFGFSASRDYSALYAAIALEAATSEPLRAKAQLWAVTALHPVETGIGAVARTQGWDGERTMEICELLIDLLDGAAARIRLMERTDIAPSEIESVFNARWTLFLRSMTVPR